MPGKTQSLYLACVPVLVVLSCVAAFVYMHCIDLFSCKAVTLLY